MAINKGILRKLARFLAFYEEQAQLTNQKKCDTNNAVTDQIYKDFILKNQLEEFDNIPSKEIISKILFGNLGDYD